MRDEKYPTSLSPVHVADMAQLKLSCSSFHSSTMLEPEEPAERKDFLAKVGATLFAHSSAPPSNPIARAPLQAVLSEEKTVLELPMKKQTCLGISTRKTVHRRKPCSSLTSAGLTVPSHIFVSRPRAPLAGLAPVSEKRRAIAVEDQRKKHAEAQKMRLERRNREFERALMRWEMIESLSVRQKLEKRYLMERLFSTFKWHLSDKSATRSKVRIVVVGGGIAGLTAASKLISMGFGSVILLEAQDRLGGRVHSELLGTSVSSLIEMGVPTIDRAGPAHGVFRQAHKYRLPMVEVQSHWVDLQIMGTDGQMIDPKLVEVMRKPCSLLLRDLNLIYKQISDQSVRTVNLAYDDYIKERKQRLIQELSVEAEGDADGMSQVIRAMVNHSKYRLGDSNGDLATQFIGYHKTPTKERGHKDMALPNGMSSLINTLTQDFFPETVQLNACVCEIQWGQKFTLKTGILEKIETPIMVTCADGQIFPADHVIVAVPLGYLKENAQRLFKPSLPQAKLDVIKRLGFGTVSKVFMYFEETFWTHPIHFTWAGTNDPRNGLLAHCIEVSSPASNIIEFSLVGAEVETLPDNYVSHQLKALLRYLHMEIPSPARMKKTDWLKNPLFRGTHPYLTTACSPDDLDIVAEPVIKEDRSLILFAGDYTHKNYQCLLHSAHASGTREALRVAYQYDPLFGTNNTNP